MSKCFIEGVGGGTKLFAVIGVTYPAGSVCTCTDGKKTLKAKTTTGLWLFAIPYAATWTVTATAGTLSKSQRVDITSEGQAVSLSLSYTMYLFSDGTYHVSVTDAPIRSSHASVSSFKRSLSGKNLVLTYTHGNTTGAGRGLSYTASKIDLSGYSKLSASGTNATVCVFSAPPADCISANGYSYAATGSGSVDVSALSGEYYVGLLTPGSSLGTVSSTISTWWLE